MMGSPARAGVLALVIAVSLADATAAKGLMFQLRDGDTPVTMLPEQVAELGDPLFHLVIRDHPNAVGLDEIEALIQPAAAQRRTFVVSEDMHEQGGPLSARSVLAFGGQAADGTDVNGKVFLSVFFAPRASRFPDVGPIEALAWDAGQGVYNYYKLDRSPADAEFSWRFRGSSRDVDILSNEDRTGTCFRCHLNGAPVMKELLLPWNNWHASRNNILGLSAPVASLRWPIARPDSGDPRITERLDGGDKLELMIVAAIERLNSARLHALKGAPDDNGRIAMADAKRALRPLFETTEINLISAREGSGLHPLGDSAAGQPGVPLCAPNSFFVNANLIAGMNGIAGFKIQEARHFQQAPDTSDCARNPLAVRSDEYRELVVSSGQSLNGARPGDVAFAWFVPEASFIDNDMVDLLIAEGAITVEFASAAVAVDLETPVFSRQRASLRAFLPESFSYEPLAGADPLAAGRHPDTLTEFVIANLEAGSPDPGTPAAEFLRLLRLDDPVAELRRRIISLREQLIAKLDPEEIRAEDRLTELLRLHDLARQRRGHVAMHQPFRNLIESTLLFPK
jgi:hypothetical protein